MELLEDEEEDNPSFQEAIEASLHNVTIPDQRYSCACEHDLGTPAVVSI